MHALKKGVVCPVYNETGTYLEICRELLNWFDVVVLVDDGSREPVEVPEEMAIILVRHPVNLGKGRALETGFGICLGQGCDVIATIDGDGEHDPRSFVPVLESYAGEGLVALSRSRFFGELGAFRHWRNRIVSQRLSEETGVDLSDSQSGMRLFSAEAVRVALDQEMPPGYAIESAMLKAISDAGFRVTEQPMLRPMGLRGQKRYSSLSVFLSDVGYFLQVAMPPKRRRGRFAAQVSELPGTLKP